MVWSNYLTTKSDIDLSNSKPCIVSHTKVKYISDRLHEDWKMLCQ